MTEPIAFSPAQAAAATGLPVDAIVAAAMNGRLKAHQAGGHVVILRADLTRFVANLPTASGESAARTPEQIAAGLARGRAIVTAMQNRPVHPARQRGREIAEQLIGKARRK